MSHNVRIRPEISLQKLPELITWQNKTELFLAF